MEYGENSVAMIDFDKTNCASASPKSLYNKQFFASDYTVDTRMSKFYRIIISSSVGWLFRQDVPNSTAVSRSNA